MDIRELLAEFAHKQWSGWMNHFFTQCREGKDGTMIIPAYYVKRWKRQMETPYAELTENEKESDRREAEGMMLVVTGKGN